MGKQKSLTPSEALIQLQALIARQATHADTYKYDDPEILHPKADKILCALLRHYQQHDVVEAFEAVRKWYA